MDVKEYIASGILELYVAGQLSEKENSEVHDFSIQHPEIVTEILAIEAAILKLSKIPAKGYVNQFESILKRISIQNKTKVIPMDKKGSNWSTSK